MQKSWIEQGKDKNTAVKEYAPAQIIISFSTYLKQKSPELTEYAEYALSDGDKTKQTPKQAKAVKAAEEYFYANPAIAKDVAYSRLYGTINAFKEFAVLNILTRGEQYSELSNMIEIFEKNISSKQNGTLCDSDINNMYKELMSYCAENKPEAGNIIKRRITSNYDSISHMEQKDIIEYGEETTKELIELLSKLYAKPNQQA